jgi:Antitoxin Phd_YefM, type II toxin-antitoxin system
MAHDPEIPFDEFSKNLKAIFSRVVNDHEPVAIRGGDGEVAILMPVDHPKKPRRPVRAKSEADYLAFLSSAGGWADVDTDSFLRDVYQSRDLPPRPAPEL